MPDLSMLDSVAGSNEGAEVEITHPVTLEPFDPSIKVWVYGVDSAEFQKAQQAATNRRLKTAGRKRGGLNVTAEELEEESLMAMAKCIFKWENVEWGGKPLECTQKNALMILQRLPWLRQQVDDFMSERSNFLPQSSLSSPNGVSGDLDSSTTEVEIS